MHRVLLINPYFLTDKHRYCKSTYHYYPTGLVYLASNLPKNQYEVKILDLFVNQLSRKEFEETINVFRPHYIGISAYTENIISAFEIADILKSIDSNLKIIMGGPHASALPELTLQENRSVDFVIAGEGENSFSILLEHLDNNLKDINLSGVYYRKNQTDIVGNGNPFIDNLDLLQFPEWQLVGHKNYKPLIRFAKDALEFPLITQRGCPYSCTFCYDLHGKKIRQRSINNVLEEIESNFNKYGAKNFAILDEVFTFDRDRTLRFCQEIINNKLSKHINFGCSTRVDLLDKNLIGKMKEAGFNRVMVGIESASEVTLASMDKGITIENVRDSIRQLKLHGFTVHASAIIGYPSEERKDIKKTIIFARSLKVDYLSINILFCYPGTRIFKEALTKGVTFKDLAWEKFSKNISVPFGPLDICDRDLKKYQLLGYAYFYSNIFKFLRLVRTFGLKEITKGFFQTIECFAKTGEDKSWL